MAEILSNQFESVFSVPKENLDDIQLPVYNIRGICDIELTEEKLKEAVQAMKSNSAPGPDGITAFIHKDPHKMSLRSGPLDLIFQKHLNKNSEMYSKCTIFYFSYHC